METALWNDFFVAEAGAAAALLGLVFVAVSINLERILQFQSLPSRVFETLAILFTVLVVATFGLVPGQSPFAFGLELVVTGGLAWINQVRSLKSTKRLDAHQTWKWARVGLNQVPPIPFVIAGVRLMNGHPSGTYWIVAGALLSFAAGISNAWVLLIEIKR